MDVVSSDSVALDWLIASKLPWGQLVQFGPEGFETYARLRFLRDPILPGEHETDVEDGVDDAAPNDLIDRAVAVLSHHTATPKECYFGLWDGWPGTLEALTTLSGSPIKNTNSALWIPTRSPERQYFVLSGSIEEYLRRAPVLDSGSLQLSLIWPKDHTWCISNDVDPHYAGIGGSRAAMETLFRCGNLDVVPADPTQGQPEFS
ncbi:MAG: hypothetical protein WA966_00530 [Ornithinimicrobium sp.]